MVANTFESLRIPTNDLTLRYQYRAGDGDPLVFFHATGFHSGVWYQVVKNLSNPIYLIDAPGHGQSERPEGDFYWNQAADRMVALIKQLDLKNVIGIGHSMGGQLMLSTAHQIPHVFQHLLLLDPVVMPLPVIQMMNAMKDSPIARRKNDWESSQEFFDAFTERAPYDTWRKDVLRDYADQALVEIEGSNRYQLACHPELEACVYRNLGAEQLLDKLAEINIPTHIIRAKEYGKEDKEINFRHSPTWAELVTRLPNATEDHRRDLNHFFPMEYPEMVTDQIKSLSRAS